MPDKSAASPWPSSFWSRCLQVLSLSLPRGLVTVNWFAKATRTRQEAIFDCALSHPTDVLCSPQSVEVFAAGILL
jgi:hypothetical protein